MSEELIVNPNLDNGREHRVGAELYNWEFNNTYDIDNVVPDIKTFIDQLYTHSLYSQSVLCDISRLYGHMSEFKRDVNVNHELGIGYYSYTLEVPMYNINCFKTLALKRANPRIYTIDDSCNMTDLFERRVLFFVNGQYFPGIKFYAEANKFILIIELGQESIDLKRINALIEADAKWSILMVPFSTTKKAKGLRSELIKGNKIDISKLTTISSAKMVSRNLWLVSIGQMSDMQSITTSTIATMVTNPDKSISLTLPDTFVSGLSATNITIDAIAIPNAKGGLLLNRGRAFQIALDSNPVPPQNIICWECNDDGSVVRYMHDVEISMYYPNVYTIDNVDPDKLIYITWCYSTDDTTHFHNPLKEYMEYNLSYANNIINNAIPQAIRSYIPYTTKYREDYYLDYHLKATRRNEFTFKYETLKDIISDDTRRLEKLYTDLVEKTAYKWHSNPKYTVKMKLWGSYADRLRRNNSKEVPYSKFVDFGLECLYFVVEHEDGRTYPIAVTIDGLRCMRCWQFTEGFRTFIYVPSALIKPDSVVEFEIMKTRSDKYTEVDIWLPKIHTSVELPDNFVDISPQNFMVARREETSDVDKDGNIQYIYRIAPNYEMYWLIFGLTEYANGIPTNYDYANAYNDEYTTAITAQNQILLDENNDGLKASTGNIWKGGLDHYLLEFGDDINYIEMPSSEFTDYNDILKVRDLGYYGDARRRFFEYLPNGEDDNPIYITPITNYFAEKWVKLVNTDVHRSWNFIINSANRVIKIKDFRLEPSSDKFRIYLDGRLLDPYTDYLMDASIKNGFYLGSPVNISIIKDFAADYANVLVEYVPYRYKLLYRVDNVTNNNIQLRSALITRPFSTVYYDVYMNGVKLTADDITVKSPSKIIINKPMNGDTLSFYERSHDQDIYDNDKYMRKSLIDAISEEDPNFRTYLLPDLNAERRPSSPSSSASCDNCMAACTTSCVHMCGTVCDSMCVGSCSGSCVGTCFSEASSSSCGGCSAGCASTCFGCTGTCIGNCTGLSTSESNNTCGGCDTACGSSCVGGCVGTSTTNTSCGGCEGTCESTCLGSCIGTTTSQVVDCGASCTGSSTVVTCNGCDGSCALTCSDSCSGTATSASCSGCSSTCMTLCTGCTGTCIGTSSGLNNVPEACNGCDMICGTSCSTSCISTCTDSCSGNCSGCTGTCDNQCTSECLGTCTGGCATTCTGNCTGTSTSSASVISCTGCYSSCIGSCSSSSTSYTSCNGCDTTCSNGCSGYCTGSCSSTCRSDCSSTCVGLSSSVTK